MSEETRVAKKHQSDTIFLDGFFVDAREKSRTRFSTRVCRHQAPRSHAFWMRETISSRLARENAS
jgi:hypothetical protein